MESLKERTAKGLFWGGMNNVVLQVVGVVFGIILGRTLNQSDFGMMAMISVFSLVGTTLQDSGFKTGLANMKSPRPEDYNSVFWFNILMGTGMYALLFFCAPLISRFYGVAELTALCRYAFLSIVIASLGTAQSAWLFKNLRARQMAKASMAAVIVSSTVGACMAIAGMAYWSLATQGLMYVGVNTLLLWHYSEWRPTMTIDFGPVKRLFPFSIKILATNITTNINNNVVNILLGRFFGKQATGVYNQAYQWDTKAYSLVQGMVSQVAQPVLVSLDDDRERQLNAFRKMMRFTAFIAFPLLFGLALVAREFIVIAITEKWLPSVELLRLLCISGAVMPLATLMSNLIISRGESGIYFRSTLAFCLTQIAVLIAIHGLGIRAIVVAYVALNLVWLLVWYFFVRRLTGYRLRHLLLDTLPFALAAALTMAVTWVITRQIGPLWVLLLSRIAIAAAVYFIIMKSAHARILDEGMDFLLKRKQKNDP